MIDIELIKKYNLKKESKNIKEYGFSFNNDSLIINNQFEILNNGKIKYYNEYLGAKKVLPKWIINLRNKLNKLKRYYKIIRTTKYHDNLIVENVLQIKESLTKKVVKSFKFWCSQGNLYIGNYSLAFEQAQKFLKEV